MALDSVKYTDGPDGSTDQAIQLDGTYGLRIATDPVDLDTTLGFWFRYQGTGDKTVWVMDSIILEYLPTTNILRLDYGGVFGLSNPTADLSDGAWHYIVTAVSHVAPDSFVRIYVDGENLGSTGNNNQPEGIANFLLFGTDGSAFSEFDFFDFSQWPTLIDIEDLNTYQAAVIADPDSVLPPEEA